MSCRGGRTEVTGMKDKQAKPQRVTEQRKSLAQNVQKAGTKPIQNPPVSPWAWGWVGCPPKSPHDING